jgi:hypothetical protein
MTQSLSHEARRNPYDAVTGKPQPSGSFGLKPCLLDGGDGLIYPLQSIGVEPFRVCGYLLSRPAQILQHVLRFIGEAIHVASMGELSRGDSDWYHPKP